MTGLFLYYLALLSLCLLLSLEVRQRFWHKEDDDKKIRWGRDWCRSSASELFHALLNFLSSWLPILIECVRQAKYIQLNVWEKKKATKEYIKSTRQESKLLLHLFLQIRQEKRKEEYKRRGTWSSTWREEGIEGILRDFLAGCSEREKAWRSKPRERAFFAKKRTTQERM